MQVTVVLTIQRCMHIHTYFLSVVGPYVFVFVYCVFVSRDEYMFLPDTEERAKLAILTLAASNRCQAFRVFNCKTLNMQCCLGDSRPQLSFACMSFSSTCAVTSALRDPALLVL